MKTFEECCGYLGISTDLPGCQIDEKKLQTVYKLRVCMKAWNKLDEFEPDEKAFYYQEKVGYTPHFRYKDGRLLSSGNAYSGSYAGLVYANASYAAAITLASLGLRLCFKTRERAISFGETFIETFNELL